MHDTKVADDDIKARRLEWEILGVTLLEPDGRVPAARHLDLLNREVDTYNSGGAGRCGSGHVPCSRRHIQDTIRVAEPHRV
jgi:hypothetical protein